MRKRFLPKVPDISFTGEINNESVKRFLDDDQSLQLKQAVSGLQAKARSEQEASALSSLQEADQETSDQRQIREMHGARKRSYQESASSLMFMLREYKKAYGLQCDSNSYRESYVSYDENRGYGNNGHHEIVEWVNLDKKYYRLMMTMYYYGNLTENERHVLRSLIARVSSAGSEDEREPFGVKEIIADTAGCVAASSVGELLDRVAQKLERAYRFYLQLHKELSAKDEYMQRLAVVCATIGPYYEHSQFAIELILSGNDLDELTDRLRRNYSRYRNITRKTVEKRAEKIIEEINERLGGEFRIEQQTHEIVAADSTDVDVDENTDVYLFRVRHGKELSVTSELRKFFGDLADILVVGKKDIVGYGLDVTPAGGYALLIARGIPEILQEACAHELQQNSDPILLFLRNELLCNQGICPLRENIGRNFVRKLEGDEKKQFLQYYSRISITGKPADQALFPLEMLMVKDGEREKGFGVASFQTKDGIAVALRNGLIVKVKSEDTGCS